MHVMGGGSPSSLPTTHYSLPTIHFLFKLLRTLLRSFALFCILEKCNSFVFMPFRTLCKKQGGGVPPLKSCGKFEPLLRNFDAAKTTAQKGKRPPDPLRGPSWLKICAAASK